MGGSGDQSGCGSVLRRGDCGRLGTMGSEREGLRTALSQRIGFADRNVRAPKRKARVGYPPGSRNARSLLGHLAGPRPIDFPRRSRSEHLAQLFEAGVLRRRTSLRTTSNYLKIRRLKGIRGSDSGQLVPKTAIKPKIEVGSPDFRKIRRNSLCRFLNDNPRERRAGFADSVAVGEEAPVEIG